MLTEIEIINRQIARIREVRAMADSVSDGEILFQAWMQMAFREDSSAE